MPVLYFLLPGDPATLTGGYYYDRRIVEELRRQGWTVRLHLLADSFPNPDIAALAEAQHILATIPDGATVVIDGLALGSMSDLVKQQTRRLHLIGLIHHPLAAETGLTAAERQRFWHADYKALAAMRHILVTSPHTARALAEYRITEDRIGIVPPGTDPAPLAVGSGCETPNLLCVATLTPRKGHTVLIKALAILRDQNWHLRCVGSLDRNSKTTAMLRGMIQELDLENRIELTGEVDDRTLAAAYHRADVFVLPSFYEGYGMVLTEALARGLPIVSTRTGAIPETVFPDAALLVPPGDSQALAHALDTLLSSSIRRQKMVEAARIARHRLVDWEMVSTQFAKQIEQVTSTWANLPRTG